MSYAEKLKDPRWFGLADRIRSRDGNRCVQCGSGGELHVHHSHYRNGREPWEYRESDLFTLCKRCHGKVHPLTKDKNKEKRAKRNKSEMLYIDRIIYSQSASLYQSKISELTTDIENCKKIIGDMSYSQEWRNKKFGELLGLKKVQEELSIKLKEVNSKKMEAFK